MNPDEYRRRCRLAEFCLPPAEYRTLLTALHDEMLAEIETLEQELATIKESLTVQEPVAYTFTRRRLDGYKTRHFLWADDYKNSPRDLKFVLDGQDDVVILYTTPNPQPKPLFAENEALRQTMAEALRWCPGGCHAQYLLKTALARAGEKE